MAVNQEELNLLLSLEERIAETPPASPSHSPGYLSDNDLPTRSSHADLSIFRDVVKDCLDYEPKPVEKPSKPDGPSKSSNEANVEKYSGLRIRNQVISPVELSQRFSDIRFVRLPTIRNLLAGDTLSGCWATVGVLTEKGNPKTSSVGKSYCIWKIGCLDETTTSVFLFGDAYQQNWKEQAGTVFALFNCSVRKDSVGTGFSLSVFSPNQILKIGTSVDYGVCKGKKKDGMPCTLVINKRQGIYCKFHTSRASERFSTTRTELKGGNLRTAFRDPLRSRGIYLVDPLADRTNVKRPMQPAKLLSVEGLRKALTNADKVTTNKYSQGIRFLNELTGKSSSTVDEKESVNPNQHATSSNKRKSTSAKTDPSPVMKKQPDVKRKVEQPAQCLASTAKTKVAAGKMIELDIFASDEEL